MVDFIPRFCGVLNVSKEVRKTAYALALMVDQAGVVAEPECMAAAAISLADTDQQCSDKEICDRLDVPIMMLTTCCNELTQLNNS